MNYRFLDQDCSPQFKNGLETAIIVGAGLAAVGAVGSAAISSHAQSKANQTNIDLAREQMAYQTSEREAVQEYNLPEVQRARYEQAGINPYFAMSNIQSGNSEMQSGVTPAHVEPNTAFADMFKDLSGIPSQVLSQYQGLQQVQATEEAIKQARIDSMYKGQEKILQLHNLSSDISVKMSQVDKNSQEYQNLKQEHRKIQREITRLDIDNKYLEEYNASRNRRERETADLVYEQKREQAAKAYYQELVNDAFPALNNAQMKLLGAQTFAAVKQGELSANMSETEKVKKIGQIISNGIASNEFKLSDLNLTSAELEAMRKGDVSKLRDKSMIFRFVDDAVEYVTDHAGTVLGFAAGRFSRNSPVKVKGFH